MSADRTPRGPGTADSPIGDALLWLGGGQVNARAEPGERPAYQVAGLIVLVNGLLAWLVATVASPPRRRGRSSRCCRAP
ncbi:hypothetical protein FXW78_51265 [Rhodococcus opacus]|nr:hypothetical protein [Rhodococcus opacus]